MSAFKSDLAEDMKDPEFAYNYGRNERELEIIKLLEEQKKIYSSPKYSTTGGFLEQFALDSAIALIKGEK